MKRGGVCRGSSNDDGHIKFVNELLQVERLTRRRDVLGADRVSADHKKVDPRFRHNVMEFDSPLRAQCTSDGDAGIPNLAETLFDEFRFNWFGIHLLHFGRGDVNGKFADLLNHGLGLVVPRPQSFEVQNTDTAELADGDGGLWRNDRVHRRSENRDLKLDRVDRPRSADCLGVASSTARHHRDVVERERTTSALGTTDFNITHDRRLSLVVRGFDNHLNVVRV